MTCEAGAPDLVVELGLARGIGELSGRGRVEISIRSAHLRAPDDPARGGLSPAFFHGIVQAYRADGAFVSGIATAASGSLTEENRVEVAVGPREVVSGSTRASLEIALSLALRDRGLFHLHAAALVDPAGAALLIVGGSGAGKTTSTLALLASGYAFLGDDALLVAATPEGPRLHTFPRPFHVAPRTLEAFPSLAPSTHETAGLGDKRDLDAALLFSDKLLASAPLPRLVLHPCVEAQAPTLLSPLGKADALGNLIASSAGLAIDAARHKEAQLDLLRQITNGARHLDLRLGADLLLDPPMLARRLEG